MNINGYNQLLNLFIFVFTGIIIGVLFDIFRIIRKSFKTPDFVTYIEDILFWLLAGIILLFSIFTFNSGEIRIYIFLGLLFGLSIYLLTLSKYFIKINVSVLTFIKKVITYPMRIIINFFRDYIFQPFRHIFDIIKLKKLKIMKKPNIYDKIEK